MALWVILAVTVTISFGGLGTSLSPAMRKMTREYVQRSRTAYRWGCAAIVTTWVLTAAWVWQAWFGLWLLAIPVILLGSAGVVVGGIATCSRFTANTGVERQKALRRAERALRDALMTSEDASS